MSTKTYLQKNPNSLIYFKNIFLVKDMKTITPRVHLWLLTGKDNFFGPGRARLLTKIKEHGSLRAAAQELGMSYRSAWGKLRKTEEVLGHKLTETIGSNREGSTLTPFAERLLCAYAEWIKAVDKEAKRLAEEILGETLGSKIAKETKKRLERDGINE